MPLKTIEQQENKIINRNIVVDDQEKDQGFFLSKKRIILIILFAAITLTIIGLTIKFVLDIDFIKFFEAINDPIDANIIWPITFLFIAGIVRPLTGGLNYLIRLRALGYKVTLWEQINYGFVIFFISSISPGNIFSDPYTVYWLKKRGMTNIDAYTVSVTNSLLWQTSQMLITLPSFVVVCFYYDHFVAWTSPKFPWIHGWIIFWLIVVGLFINVWSLGFYILLAFSNRTTFILSLTFNTIKKYLGLKYHTLQQTKAKYLDRADGRRRTINMMKDYLTTSMIFACYTANEILIYVLLYISFVAIVPPGKVVEFYDLFNIANVAVTANKLMPIPGAEGTLQLSMKMLIEVINPFPVGHRPTTVDELAVYSDNGIMVWKIFITYMPAILGMFVSFTTIMFNIKKITNLLKENKK